MGRMGCPLLSCPPPLLLPLHGQQMLEGSSIRAPQGPKSCAISDRCSGLALCSPAVLRKKGTEEPVVDSVTTAAPEPSTTACE